MQTQIVEDSAKVHPSPLLSHKCTSLEKHRIARGRVPVDAASQHDQEQLNYAFSPDFVANEVAEERVWDQIDWCGQRTGSWYPFEPSPIDSCSSSWDG